MEQFRGTTIVAVKKDGKTVIAGDGQVTMGQQVILKGTAHKVRRLFDGKVVVVWRRYSNGWGGKSKKRTKSCSFRLDESRTGTWYFCGFVRDDF